MADEIERHNKMVLRELVMGDLVEFPGPIYSHWAVYIGGCEVVHLSGINRSRTAADSPSSGVFTISGIAYTNAHVKRENFWIVASESKVEKNNGKDRAKRPFSSKVIKERALSKKGQIFYSVLLNNCEHFATWCRYGIKESKQVDAALTSCLVMGAKVATTGIVLGTAKVATKGIVLGGLSVLASIADRKSEPTSCNATNFGNVIAGGRNEIPVLPQVNGATSWFSVGLTVLFGVGKLCYDAYTGGNDRRESSTSYSSRMDYFADGRDSNLNTFIRESSTSYSPRMDYFADGRGSNLNTFIRALSASQSPGWNNFGDWTGIGIQPTGRFCFNQGRRTGAFTWKC